MTLPTTFHSDEIDVSNVEAAFSMLYTALTILTIGPDDPIARRIAGEALRDTRPLLLHIMNKAGLGQ